MLHGPIELAAHVPIALSTRADTVDAVINMDGRPRVISRPIGPAVPGGTAPQRESAAASDAGAGFGVPCAIAGDRIFCPDRTGAVHRTNRDGGDDRVVASARPSSRIAAATFGGSHVALGYLASRQTTEGWVSEAWLAVDESAPRRISEDGSGATAVALAPRGSGVTALLVDARAALTAVHARPIEYDGHTLRLGEDAVLFVGGPGDRRTRAAVALPPSGVGWSFLPISRDVASFGLASIRVDDPPRVDEAVAWTPYPNGLDPAPVSAAPAPGVGGTTWVALVRPTSAELSSPRVLELGRVTPDGSLERSGTVRTDGAATDVALVADAYGALWLGWVDAGGSWLERLSCGLPRHGR